MKTTTHWKGGLAFESHFNQHKIHLDTSVAGGGTDTGFNPKAVLLSSLAGCTAMDVVEILEKMRVEFSSLEIEVEAEQTETQPKVFKDFNITYRFNTDPANRDKIKKAVDLSMDKYCGVSAMLKKHAPIHYEIIITS
jgi:putative redox protein